MDIVRDAIRAEKKVLVAENVGLTETEATAFWPIYEEYQNARKTVADDKIKIIEEFAKHYNADTMTDEIAEDLIKKSMTAESDLLKLKGK